MVTLLIVGLVLAAVVLVVLARNFLGLSVLMATRMFAGAAEHGFIGVAVYLACWVLMFPVMVIISLGGALLMWGTLRICWTEAELAAGPEPVGGTRYREAGVELGEAWRVARRKGWRWGVAEQRAAAEALDDYALGLPAIVTLDVIDIMGPLLFERWCLERLRSAGYTVGRTPKGSGLSRRIGLAEHGKTGECIIVLCKHTRAEKRYIGDDAVQELLAAKKAYGRPEASLLVVTNARNFTGHMEDVANKEGVWLVARHQLSPRPDWHEVSLRPWGVVPGPAPYSSPWREARTPRGRRRAMGLDY